MGQLVEPSAAANTTAWAGWLGAEEQRERSTHKYALVIHNPQKPKEAQKTKSKGLSTAPAKAVTPA